MKSLSDMFTVAIALDLFAYTVSLIQWPLKPNFQNIIPYSRKYWWELNSAVGSQIAITNVLADLNLAVRYGIAIHI